MKKERGAPLAAKLCRVGQADGVRGTQRSDRRSEGAATAAAAAEEKKKSGERRNRSHATITGTDRNTTTEEEWKITPSKPLPSTTTKRLMEEKHCTGGDDNLYSELKCFGINSYVHDEF